MAGENAGWKKERFNVDLFAIGDGNQSSTGDPGTSKKDKGRDKKTTSGDSGIASNQNVANQRPGNPTEKEKGGGKKKPGTTGTSPDDYEDKKITGADYKKAKDRYEKQYFDRGIVPPLGSRPTDLRTKINQRNLQKRLNYIMSFSKMY